MSDCALDIFVLQKERELVETDLATLPVFTGGPDRTATEKRYRALAEKERRLTKKIDELVEELMS